LSFRSGTKARALYKIKATEEGPMMPTFSHSMDMILTISVLSFWFLFPIGIILSVAYVDKHTDQIVRLDHETLYDRDEEAPEDVVTIVPQEKTPLETGRAA
jgi:hypothetical protein